MDGQGLCTDKPLPTREPEIEPTHAAEGFLVGLSEAANATLRPGERLGVGAAHFGSRGY
jgi:hypothetical protein